MSVITNIDSFSRESLVSYLKDLRLDLLDNEPDMSVYGNNHMMYFNDHDEWVEHSRSVDDLIYWLGC